jgi:hypothetical protein
MTGVEGRDKDKNQEEAELKELLGDNDRNLEILKMKVKYMTKKQTDL